MREQRAEIGKAFMEGQHVGIGGLGEVGADSVDDGVGHLMRDDVLRETGENALTRKVATLTGLARCEETEQDPVRLGVVIGVGLLHGMRIELENANIVLLAKGVIVLLRTETIGPAPMDVASQRRLEHLDGSGSDRIDHLLVEAGIRLRRIETVVRQQERVVEVDGRIIALVGGVVVNDTDLTAGWTWRELLPRHMDGRKVASISACTRIEGVDLQCPERRRRHFQPRVTLVF